MKQQQLNQLFKILEEKTKKTIKPNTDGQVNLL